jgi:hypothetical protein
VDSGFFYAFWVADEKALQARGKLKVDATIRVAHFLPSAFSYNKNKVPKVGGELTFYPN